MQGEEFLRSPSLFEAELSAFLLACRSMRLLHKVVAAGGGNDLDVLHTVEHSEFPYRSSAAPELIGLNDLWNIIFPQEVREKGCGCSSVAVFLQENVEHVSELVYSPP